MATIQSMLESKLDAIENGTANLMKFKVYTGKRYYKIVQQEFETWEKSKYYGQYRWFSTLLCR